MLFRSGLSGVAGIDISTAIGGTLSLMPGAALAAFLLATGVFPAAAVGAEPAGQHYKLTARASQLDSTAKAYPEIGFVFEKDGKPQDVQHASVDTGVESKGRLVIWLMSHNSQLFDRINSYGMHAIQPHYANKWFGILCRQNPVGENCRGNIRLEAATGMDVSDDVAIAPADSIAGRSLKFIQHLAETNPAGNWGQFLDETGSEVRWDRVILAGSSHGSTTAARFAKQQAVDRVVMLCGPRDQHQVWQSLPSATDANRYFGFSHVRDMGWEEDHYCRSWELMGLNQFGPIVNVDQTDVPFGNTRRLVTDFPVPDASAAHSSVTPGKRSKKNDDGSYAHEEVWRYLFTHPVNVVGEPVAIDEGCDKEQSQ